MSIASVFSATETVVVVAAIAVSLPKNAPNAGELESWLRRRVMSEKVAWREKRVWVKQGAHFAVEIVHWTDDWPTGITRNGHNHWNVYAYIYAKHRLFEPVKNREFNALPLHGGETYRRYHWDERGAKIVSIQVGSDYSHFGDDRFSHMTILEDSEVERDAEYLFDFLADDTRREHDFEEGIINQVAQAFKEVKANESDA